jgi:uncharacterized membrane-anchored protein
MNRSLALVLALAPQVLVLVGIIAREEHTLREGTRAVLEVRGYDPVDVLSGRYLALPLAITRLPAEEIALPSPPIAEGTTVWVGLERAEPYWKPFELVLSPPGVAASADRVWLRGRLAQEWSGAPDREQDPDATPPVDRRTGRPPGEALLVDYGLDRFYIPEKAADPTLRSQPGLEIPDLAYAVRVTADGRAVIEDLLVAGEPYAAWNARQAR